ncbi:hypothetical protein DFH08DRAFT_965424 [Mycena albidolilacea]|uniref:Uncharacterized protein n=1 Tax=Mycena albidolilacea TaxID=1033008 RepID=A0AAD7EMB3_9AGAR|nr:hypothetical protein DFH08DRAFT_965424 [Mycena albidolilacea]
MSALPTSGVPTSSNAWAAPTLNANHTPNSRPLRTLNGSPRTPTRYFAPPSAPPPASPSLLTPAQLKPPRSLTPVAHMQPIASTLIQRSLLRINARGTCKPLVVCTFGTHADPLCMHARGTLRPCAPASFS